ncbi:MAG: type II secretion system F family protein [Phycisphaerales bacterium]|nr:type II secretion system F family protein [Phycisphaerales bacterium]
MEIALIAVMLAASAATILYSLLPRREDQRDTVRRRLAGGRGVDEQKELAAKAKTMAAESLVHKARPALDRLVMPISDEEQTALRTRLASAGFRNQNAQTVFLASKSIIGVAALAIVAVAGVTGGWQLSSLMGGIAFAAGVGFMLPNMWLGMAVSARKEKIRNGLPDTLDLMVVSVESGLALDAAIKRVGEEMASVHADLSDEMRIATMEAQMGIPRGEALENMGRRCGLDEVRSLVSVILQAEKFGTSIAKALRNQADSLRTKRRQAAEERAQKTAVKLMLPLVIFIFPAMGVVLAGPAAIKMMQAAKDNPALIK